MTSNNKHTPGRWFYGRWGDVDDGEPEPFFRVGPMDVEGGCRVCSTAHEADARLIAAAPDLLEACEAAENFMRTFGVADGDYAAFRPDFDRLIAAIKKARGET